MTIRFLKPFAVFILAPTLGFADEPRVRFNSPDHQFRFGTIWTKDVDQEFFINLAANAPCDAKEFVDAIKDDRGRITCEAQDMNCIHHMADSVVRACLFPFTQGVVCKSAFENASKDEYDACVVTSITGTSAPITPYNATDENPIPDLMGATENIRELVPSVIDVLQATYPSEDEIRNLTNLSLPERNQVRQSIEKTSDMEMIDTYCKRFEERATPEQEELYVSCVWQQKTSVLQRNMRHAAIVYSILD